MSGTQTRTASRTEAQPGDGFKIGNLGRHSLIYLVGLVLSKAVSFVMLPIYTRLLTPADYGILQLIVMTFEVVTIFAGSRIAFGIFHFYHKEDDEGGRMRVLSTAFFLLSFTYAAAALATVAAAPTVAGVVFGESAEYATYVRIAAASMAFEGLLLVPTALFQLQDRSVTFVTMSMAKLGMQVVLNLIFLIPLEMGVVGVLLSSMITNAVIGTTLAVRLLFTVGARFEGAAARSFLRFGLPLVVMQVATFLFTFGDRYFLNRAGDTAAVGLYGLAYQFGFLVANFGYLPFQRVWDPQRFAVAKRPDKDQIFARVFIYLNVLLFSAALGIAIFGGDVIRIIAAPSFHSAASYIPLIAIAYVLHSWGSFLSIGMYITEKTEYFTVAQWAAGLVALVGYMTMIPPWLAWGAAVATVLSLGVRFLMVYIFSQRLWYVAYRWGPILRLGALALGIGGAATALPATSLLVSVAAHAALYGAFLVLAWYLPILPSEERATIRGRVVQTLEGLRRRVTA